MDMMELLGKTGGLQSMARELGVREEEAHSGAAALLPAILGGFKKQAQPQQNSEDGWAACSASSAAARCSTTCSPHSRRT